MTACAAELQSQAIWLHTTRVNNGDRRRPEKRSDAGERKGKQMSGCGWGGWVCAWIDFISFYQALPLLLFLTPNPSSNPHHDCEPMYPRRQPFDREVLKRRREALWQVRLPVHSYVRQGERERRICGGHSAHQLFIVLFFFPQWCHLDCKWESWLRRCHQPHRRRHPPGHTDNKRLQKGRQRREFCHIPHLFILHIPQSSCQDRTPELGLQTTLKKGSGLFGGVERRWRVYPEPALSDSAPKQKKKKKRFLFSSLRWSLWIFMSHKARGP